MAGVKAMSRCVVEYPREILSWTGKGADSEGLCASVRAEVLDEHPRRAGPSTNSMLIEPLTSVGWIILGLAVCRVRWQ